MQEKQEEPAICVCPGRTDLPWAWWRRKEHSWWSRTCTHYRNMRLFWSVWFSSWGELTIKSFCEGNKHTQWETWAQAVGQSLMGQGAITCGVKLAWPSTVRSSPLSWEGCPWAPPLPSSSSAPQEPLEQQTLLSWLRFIWMTWLIT